MLKADIYTYNKVEYIVIDTAMITIENKGLAALASYRHGVGADRILLVDKSLEQIIISYYPKIFNIQNSSTNLSVFILFQTGKRDCHIECDSPLRQLYNFASSKLQLELTGI